MNRRLAKKITHFIGLVAVVVAVLSSCKSTETVSTVKLRNIPPKKIISKVVQNNNTPFESLSCKKVGISVKGNNGKGGSLRGIMTILNDSAIFISANKISVPIAKVLITPDSVKLVNYLQKNYIASDITQLSDVYNLNLDFWTLQNILSYKPFADYNDHKSNQYNDFISYTENGNYVLQSAKNRKIEKILNKTEKNKELRPRFLSDYQIIQRIYINPHNFLVETVSLIDYTEGREVWIRFSEFQNCESKIFPRKIKVIAKKIGNVMEIDLSFGKITLNSNEKIIFNIPNKYQSLSMVNQ